MNQALCAFGRPAGQRAFPVTESREIVCPSSWRPSSGLLVGVYDADKTVAAFAARLRDAVDLDSGRAATCVIIVCTVASQCTRRYTHDQE
jgi:hypothetical protein